MKAIRGYDIVGNIIIVKFDRKARGKDKKKEAERLLREHKSARTILEKIDKFKGRLRKQKTKWIMGEKTKEALCKENNCVFRLNVDSCYFSPRLANERAEIAGKVRKGENVLVMFGGVAPFAVVIAKLARPKKVVSVELGRECNKYANENVKRNKVMDVVELVQGDARKILPKMREKFDRIVMPRPNLKDTFLSYALKASKNETVIHYYGFCKEQGLQEMKEAILNEAKKAKKKIKIIRVKKAGDIGVRTFRYCLDLLA